MKQKILLLTLLFISLSTIAQKQPDWLRQGKKPISKSSKFVYVIGIGAHQYTDTAQMKAFDNMVRELSRQEGETYQVEGVTKTEVENRVYNQSVTTDSKLSFVGTIYSKGNKITRHIQEIDHYREGIEYYGLYRIAENAKDLKMPFYYYHEVKKSSSFVPGIAQLKKQQKTKGLLFLGGEISLLTGLAVSQIMYSNYNSNFNYYIQKSDLRNAELAAYNRDNASIVRTGCLIGAAGLYVYNIIDGLLTKGKPQYANNSIKIYPNLGSNGLGISASIKFD